jgi:hypothetical protein
MESNQCRPWIPNAPLTGGTRDLNSFAVGGVADGDGSRQADLKGLQAPECLLLDS